MAKVKLTAMGLLVTLGLVSLLPALQTRVYSVPEVLAGLARDPASWSGRTALVWGIALRLVPGCPRGQWCPTGLYRPGTRRPGPILLVEKGPAPPLATRLRGMPVLRNVPILQSVVPAQQRLHWHGPATYVLFFSVVPNTTCDAKPCINALLVDTA
jgi:hypothetical protein